MSEIINLRRARKRRQRDAASLIAQENRANYGREKSERSLTQANLRRNANSLEAHLRAKQSDDTA